MSILFWLIIYLKNFTSCLLIVQSTVKLHMYVLNQGRSMYTCIRFSKKNYIYVSNLINLILYIPQMTVWTVIVLNI